MFECNGAIEGNIITKNSAGDEGGGLYDCGGTIANNTITENSAFGGGGLCWCHGTIENNTIRENSADRWGAGLFECDGTVENNTIIGNEAGEIGGGLAGCQGLIRDNIIAENKGGEHGGGLLWCDNTIERNIITANSAGQGGGLASCHARVRDNLIARNFASGSGGGLAYCRGEVMNNTIAANFAAAGGGLASCEGTVQNCVLWGNIALSDPQVSASSIPTYSCIQGWTGGGEGNINEDPEFADPDGPDDDPNTYVDNDYRLKPNSPCIDTGRNEEWMWNAFDLDGNPRIFRGRPPEIVDIGAYEYVHFIIQKLERTPDGKIRLTWKSRPGTSYGVHVSGDLKLWTWAGQVIPASGTGTNIWAETISAARRFYIVERYE